MEVTNAVAALAALAHEGRLSLFRLLVREGSTGLAAGEIARRLKVRPNTLSASLNLLSRAGLVTWRRDGRSIIYAASYDGMRRLMAFLVEDCCDGAAEICAPLSEVLQRAACCLEPQA